ncbi:MAG: enoyl-CoA hydratase/isomerase family protein [Gammaproteobacteria bacterium]|nr:enoyl-CoA hydratase/isomerase family protein [Gammaproteobacteria bacterium]
MKILKTLELKVKDGVAWLYFNRPLAMNTYNFEMSQELPECIESIAENKDIKILVLSGANNIFMAGGDIELLKQAGQDNQEQTAAAIASLHEVILSLKTMDKLVIAAVQGACAGAGISIMLAADLAYAEEGTKFNTAYINLGLSPDGGMSYSLPRIVGYKKALELILLSELFFAEEAYKLGLVNKVLTKTEFNDYLNNLTKKLLNKSGPASNNIKNLIRSTWDSSLEQQLNDEKNCFLSCTKTEEFRLGIEDFLNKKIKK